MTPSELLVGRRLPILPGSLDLLMAAHVSRDGVFSYHPAPEESWMRNAHHEARQKGWLRASNLTARHAGREKLLWRLTSAGEKEALAARDRVEAIRTARADWATDLRKAQRTLKSDRDIMAARDIAPESSPSL